MSLEVGKSRLEAIGDVEFRRGPTVIHADRKIRGQMAERRATYNQVAELTNRIKTRSRQS